jgi:hypothetical protein
MPDTAFLLCHFFLGRGADEITPIAAKAQGQSLAQMMLGHKQKAQSKWSRT